MDLDSQGYISFSYLNRPWTKKIIRKPISEESNMFFVRNFVHGFVIVILHIFSDSSVGEVEVYLCWESWVEDLTQGRKPCDGSPVEKSWSYHPTREMKGVGRTFPKKQRSKQHRGTNPMTSSG